MSVTTAQTEFGRGLRDGHAGRAEEYTCSWEYHDGYEIGWTLRAERKPLPYPGEIELNDHDEEVNE